LHSFPSLGHDLTDSVTANFIIQKTAEFFYSILTSTKEMAQSPFSLRAYPNPSSDQIHLTLGAEWSEPSTFPQGLTFEVNDAFGRTVSSGLWQNPQEPLTLDLAASSSGIYFLRVYTRDGRGAELRLVRRP
jgi:hypothetical protein